MNFVVHLFHSLMVNRMLLVFSVLLSGAALALHFWPTEKPVEVTDHEYPLLEAMGYYQRFSHKLWLALENENWELAEFYVHELEEVTEEFVASKVVDEDLPLSEHANQILAPAIEEMDNAIDARDAVLAGKNYLALVQSCNACHARTKHAYIKLLVPDSVQPYNQDFGR